MYGPQGRALPLLYTVAVVLLFAGALALPLLSPEETVRPEFPEGEGDGLRLQGSGGSTGSDAATRSAARQPGPGKALRAPSATLASPGESATVTFDVSWGHAPATHPYFVFQVQYTTLTKAQTEGLLWDDWYGAQEATSTGGIFTGEPDETYGFRARTCTFLRHDCSDWSDPTTTRVTPEAAAANVTLDLERHLPIQHTRLTGQALIRWDAHHAGPGDASVEVAVRSIPYGEWVPIYSGLRTSTTWDTTRHDDGRHELRLVVRDGAFEEEDLVEVVVDNQRGDGADPDDRVQAASSERDAHEAPMPPVWVLLSAALLVLASGRRVRQCRT